MARTRTQKAELAARTEATTTTPAPAGRSEGTAKAKPETGRAPDFVRPDILKVASTISELEDWFSAHESVAKQAKLAARAPEVAGFLNFLWPVATDYFSPINPIFLSECIDLEHLNKHPVWMARDGIVPLLWFFRSFPDPRKVKSRILVHQDLYKYVPSPWREHTGTYRLGMLPTAPKVFDGAKRKLFVTGLLMDTYCSIKHAGKLLDAVAETLGAEALKEAEVMAFLAPKLDGFGNEHRHEFFTDFILQVGAKLGCKITALNWKKLEALESTQGFEVIDLNERLLWSDSYLVHHVLNRGGKLFRTKADPPELPGGDEHVVPLSPYHGVFIRKKPTDKTQWNPKEAITPTTETFLKSIPEIMQSEANRRFPWPHWFTEWSKSNLRPDDEK